MALTACVGSEAPGPHGGPQAEGIWPRGRSLSTDRNAGGGAVPACHVKNGTVRASQTAAPFRGLCREPPGLQTPSDRAVALPSVLLLKQEPLVYLRIVFIIKEISCPFTGVF